VSDDPTVILDCIETEHASFDVTLFIRFVGCGWRRTIQGSIGAVIAGQAHQVLHSQFSPFVPGIELGPDEWLLPPRRCSP
jgi:hypothetical protein